MDGRLQEALSTVLFLAVAVLARFSGILVSPLGLSCNDDMSSYCFQAIARARQEVHNSSKL